MRKSIFFLFFILCTACFFIYGDCIQQPPKGWECIRDPEQLPKKILELYVGKGTSDTRFSPSLNVAHEETNLPIDQYVSVAKSYHEGQAGTRCTSLGKIMTAAGSAQLLQIDRPSQWGPIRFLQALMIYQGEAYVITSTCLKNDFSALSPHLFQAIQSFTIVK